MLKSIHTSFEYEKAWWFLSLSSKSMWKGLVPLLIGGSSSDFKADSPKARLLTHSIGPCLVRPDLASRRDHAQPVAARLPHPSFALSAALSLTLPRDPSQTGSGMNERPHAPRRPCHRCRRQRTLSPWTRTRRTVPRKPLAPTLWSPRVRGDQPSHLESRGR